MPRVQWFRTMDGTFLRASAIYALGIREAIVPGTPSPLYQVVAYINPNAPQPKTVAQFPEREHAELELERTLALVTEPSPADTMREAADLIPGLLRKFNGDDTPRGDQH